MNVVILCGGQGTRAYPLTRRMPKALMPVGGLPIVEQVMHIYAAHGYREFILSVGYLKDEISKYFADRIMSTRFPPQVELMREETLKTLSGTSSMR